MPVNLKAVLKDFLSPKISRSLNGNFVKSTTHQMKKLIR